MQKKEQMSVGCQLWCAAVGGNLEVVFWGNCPKYNSPDMYFRRNVLWMVGFEYFPYPYPNFRKNFLDHLDMDMNFQNSPSQKKAAAGT